MIGVAEPRERGRILDELYLETARHYRQVRIVEVQKQVQRAGGQRRLTADDIAASIWDSLGGDDKGPPLTEWLKTLKAERQVVNIPDGKAKALGKGHMFDPAGVDFTQGKTIHHETYASPEQAALVALLANLEIRGQIELPADKGALVEWRQAIEKRLADARSFFDALAGSRTGTETLGRRCRPADAVVPTRAKGRRGMTFRSSASFGNRQEYVAVAELLRHGHDVYMTLVDGRTLSRCAAMRR